MNAKTLIRTASALFAAGLVLANATEASAAPTCDDPTRIDVDEHNLNSWPLIGGTWTALANPGMSDSHCYAKDDAPAGQPQVMFEYAGSWHLAIAADCSYPPNNIPIGSVTDPGDPSTLSFVHSLRMLTLEITADDYYAAYIDDGSTSAGLIGMDALSHDHSNIHTVEVRGGDHSMIVDSKDIYGSVAGMAASLEIEGCSGLLLTGVDDWQFDTTPFVYPGASGDAFYVTDDFGHDPWGNLGTDGAEYIWWSPNAQDLGRAVFTLDFFVE
jgi:hypothetical protein